MQTDAKVDTAPKGNSPSERQRRGYAGKRARDGTQQVRHEIRARASTNCVPIQGNGARRLSRSVQRSCCDLSLIHRACSSAPNLVPRNLQTANILLITKIFIELKFNLKSILFCTSRRRF